MLSEPDNMPSRFRSSLPSTPSFPATDPALIARLQAAIQGLHHHSIEPMPAIDLGWPEFKQALPPGQDSPLTFGAIHEFFGLASSSEPASRIWRPPLGLLLYLASRPPTHAGPPVPSSLSSTAASPSILWIGRKIWPSGFALQTAPGLLARSILVDAGDEAERLWAIDVALRSSTSPASIIVVADGTGLSLASTRRLQLAAEAGRSIALLARPPWEQTSLSVAATRWHIAPASSKLSTPPGTSVEHPVHRRILPPPRWSLRLLRWKTAGLTPAMDSASHTPRQASSLVQAHSVRQTQSVWQTQSLWQTWTLEDLTHDAHGRKMVCLPPPVANAAIPPSTAAG